VEIVDGTHVTRKTACHVLKDMYRALGLTERAKSARGHSERE
jgi:hypothetical protein